MNPPVIALTVGDPAGIGPELLVRAASGQRQCRFKMYGPPLVLEEAVRRFAEPGFTPEIVPCGNLNFNDFSPGTADGKCGLTAYDALTCAVKDACDGKVDAIVTAPINKSSVNLAGIPFTGHTERIAELCECGDYVMMLSSGGLRVVFVTCHIPFAEVPGKIDFSKTVNVAHLLHREIIEEGIAEPKLAVCGLNPHAGENGFMGREETDILIPATRHLRSLGVDVEGPIPPDTMFMSSVRSRYDGIVAMYHDQGHIPFKMLAFESGVNSTLGLPVIRTSPDHGTAFDIAWQGRANIRSFECAIDLALRRISHKS